MCGLEVRIDGSFARFVNDVDGTVGTDSDARRAIVERAVVADAEVRHIRAVVGRPYDLRLPSRDTGVEPR